MCALGNQFSQAAALAGRLREISTKDVEFSLSIRGQLRFLNKTEVLLSFLINLHTHQVNTPWATPACTAEVDDMYLTACGVTRQIPPVFLGSDKKSFRQRKASFRRGPNVRCMTILGNELAAQMHEIRQLSEFSMPRLLFLQFIYKAGIAGLFLLFIK
jgi:hypothetical protein